MSAPLILPTVTMTLRGHPPRGHLRDPRRGRLDIRICMGGTEFQREFVLPLGGFDDEHVPRARGHRALQCRHPDAAETDDGNVVTRPDGGRLGG